MNSKCKAGSLLVGWMLAVIPASPLLATSFDCEQAKSATEKAICGNGQLSDLDSKLDSYYDEALRTVEDAQALKEQQRAWLPERDRCEGDEHCIAERYEERIAALIEKLPHASVGSRYRLVKEEYSPFLDESQHGLCSAVVDTLNRTQPVRPMVCGFDIPAGLGRISTPDWKEIDPEEHMDMIREIVRFRDRNLSDEKQAENWRRDKAVLEAGEARLWRSEFDINNELGDEVVLRHDLYGCDPEKDMPYGGGWYLGAAVLNESGTALAEGYWRLHHRPELHPFFYKGRTWLWRWWGTFAIGDIEVAVYRAGYALGEFGWANTPTCKIDYVE